MAADDVNRAENSGDEAVRQLSFLLKESQLQSDEYKRQYNEVKNLLETADGQLDDVRGVHCIHILIISLTVETVLQKAP
jgi:hypothetical protein